MLLLRMLTLAGLLLLLAPAAWGQRPRVTAATVFRDVDGTVLSKKDYKSKLKTNGFTTNDARVSNGRIISIGLKPADGPDNLRTEATSQLRAYHTVAPAFTAADIYGTVHLLAALRGKVVVLNFWFIKCAFCREEMPALKQLTTDYRDSTDVVFISFARDEARALRRYMAQQGSFGFSVLPLTKELGVSYGLSAYPTTVVIDKAGRYAYDMEGYSGNLLRLREAIRQAR